MTIIWYVVPEIWSATEKILVILDHFFPFTPLATQKIKILKKWKKLRDRQNFCCFGPSFALSHPNLHMCTMCTMFLGYTVQQTELFVILGHFLPFNSMKPWKIKISKKWKKMPGGIIILNKCTKNHDHMPYCSWDMARDGCNIYFHFQLLFALLTPNNSKSQIFKK